MAKGNADVRGSLHSLHEDDAVTWNGLGALVRQRHPDWSVRIIHETMTRSDAVLAAEPIPAALQTHCPSTSPFDATAQFDSRLFDGDTDVVVLSVQPDVMNHIVSHRTDRHLFYPYDARNWSPEDGQWLTRNYQPQPMLDAEQSMANLAGIVERVRRQHDPIILIYNMSPIVLWERIHCYQGVGETLAERIRSFNRGLIGLSRAAGVSIVDVDAVVARGGADRLKVDAVSLTALGCEMVAREVLRILEDEGCFALARAA